VTVVVPTKNSGETLGACLESVKNQSYQNIEIIVVDNCSSDDTRLIASRYTDKVFEVGPERSAQRNYGAEHAGGQYLLFPDSDMVLSVNVARQCVELVHNEPDVLAMVLPEESFGVGFWAECRRLERLFYRGVDWLEAARFFRRDVFLAMGGYDLRNTGTEDFDLPQRIKASYGADSIGRISDLVYHDEQRRSLRDACRTNYYYGHGLDAYMSVEANRENFRKQQSVFKRYGLFFSNPGMLFKNPVLGIGVLFMKLCEFGSWGAGFLTGKVSGALRGHRGNGNDDEITRVLALLWHSSYDIVITAGGFKRTHEIFQRTPDDFEIVAIDNNPSFLSDLNGERVRVLEYQYPWFFSWLEREHFLVERVLEWFLAPIYMLLMILKLMLRGERFDVVLVPSSEILPALFAGVVAKYLLGAGLVLCNMNIDLFSSKVKKVVAMLHNRADTVVTLSNDLADSLHATGVKVPMDIERVGLDVDFIEHTLAGVELPKRYDAIFVGRHGKSKGIFELIETWRLVCERLPKATLVTVGSCDPNHKEAIESMIDQYKLRDNVLIMGILDEDAKFRLIKESKVMVFPSRVEGWGIVPHEGLACGLPVVTYDLPVYQENIMPCEAVFAVPLHDFKAMAERTIDLLVDDKYEEYEDVGPSYPKGPDWDEVARADFESIKANRKKCWRKNTGK